MAIDQIRPEALHSDTVQQTTQKPEFYGFRVNSDGELLVDTTALGSDSITDTTIYKDYMINIQGITFQINTTTGNLEMVIN
jgi:hypothetical protein